MFGVFHRAAIRLGLGDGHVLARLDLGQGVGEVLDSALQETAERLLLALAMTPNTEAEKALKLAGVDLSTPEPIEETFGVLTGLIDRLEQLVLG